MKYFKKLLVSKVKKKKKQNKQTNKKQTETAQHRNEKRRTVKAVETEKRYQMSYNNNSIGIPEGKKNWAKKISKKKNNPI